MSDDQIKMMNKKDLRSKIAELYSLVGDYQSQIGRLNTEVEELRKQNKEYKQAIEESERIVRDATKKEAEMHLELREAMARLNEEPPSLRDIFRKLFNK